MTAVTTASITDFLLARIEAEEQIARETVAGHDPLDWSISQPGVGIEGPVDGPSGYEAIIVDPARVLADCAARRAIVELGWHHFGEDEYADGMEYAKEQVLRLMVQPYSDHPDFDPSWAI